MTATHSFVESQITQHRTSMAPTHGNPAKSQLVDKQIEHYVQVMSIAEDKLRYEHPREKGDGDPKRLDCSSMLPLSKNDNDSAPQLEMSGCCQIVIRFGTFKRLTVLIFTKGENLCVG